MSKVTHIPLSFQHLYIVLIGKIDIFSSSTYPSHSYLHIYMYTMLHE